MATELVTRIWCDVHLEAKDEQVTGRPYSYDGQDIDLCEDCAAPFLAVAELVSEYGRTEGKRKYRKRIGNGAQPVAEPSSEMVCPDCGQVCKNRHAFGAHARRMHDKSGSQMLGLDTPHTCDVCERQFATRQGLAAHRARSHPDAGPLPT